MHRRCLSSRNIKHSVLRSAPYSSFAVANNEARSLAQPVAAPVGRPSRKAAWFMGGSSLGFAGRRFTPCAIIALTHQ